MDRSLAIFPDEIIAKILSASAASDMVVSLWLCGNQALNTRLSRRGCTSFVASVSMLTMWPRVLSQLKSLQTVFITALAAQEPIEWMSKHAMDLPSCLEELHLDFPFAGLIFSPDIHWELSYVYRPCLLPSEEGNMLPNLNTLFPNLRHLVLEAKSYFTRVPLSLADIQHLPRGLQTFNSGAHTMELPELFQALPSSLTSLAIDSEVPANQALPLLPKSVTYIREPSYVVSTDPFDPSMALRTLLLQAEGLNLNDLQKLPNGLTRLHLICDIIPSPFSPSGKPWTSFLPASLTSLRYAGQLSTEDIGNLSADLLTLEIDSVLGLREHLATVNSTEDRTSFWPKRLQSLSIQARYHAQQLALSPSTIPRTLTHLTLYDGDIAAVDDDGPLPDSLTHLQLGPYTTPPSNKFSLPNGLRSLTVVQPASRKLSFPQNLTQLVLYSTDGTKPLDKDLIVSLPPKLEHLTLSSVWVSDLCLLPRSLESLSLQSLSGEINESRLAGLPPCLKSLKMNDLSSNKMVCQAFAHLPPSLKELDLRLWRAPLEFLVHLTTTVSVLSLKSVTHISEETARLLPLRWLRFLLDRKASFDCNQLPILHALWPESLPITPLHQAQLVAADIPY